MYFNNYYSTQQITRINGENGARMYQLQPNSSALLLDDTAPLVWLVQSDGAGYKTVTPYKIEPYIPEPTPDLNEILKKLNDLEVKVNDKSYTREATAEQRAD